VSLKSELTNFDSTFTNVLSAWIEGSGLRNLDPEYEVFFCYTQEIEGLPLIIYYFVQCRFELALISLLFALFFVTAAVVEQNDTAFMFTFCSSFNLHQRYR